MANYNAGEQHKKGCYGTKLIGASKTANLQDKAREDLGLTPRKVTARKCLRCDVEFVSRTEQRRCNPCREWARDNWEMI